MSVNRDWSPSSSPSAAAKTRSCQRFMPISRTPPRARAVMTGQGLKSTASMRSSSMTPNTAAGRNAITRLRKSVDRRRPSPRIPWIIERTRFR